MSRTPAPVTSYVTAVRKLQSTSTLIPPYPLTGTSSGVTGFTTPRYPSVCSPFEFLPFLSFCFFLPSLEGRRGSSPREAVAALFASCFSWTATYPHVATH
ncbi:hypothetical protein AVEN_54374-1 [Araneus ventricosus]|uniref:Uncharacterized protein n=1 Tax=Araneus ventricosus TaxID=182803 RepID=A0A4Y2FY02_ARAVE|nr:hypothetical protein AVEN_54374-1 [Araneus ventricosus]